MGLIGQIFGMGGAAKQIGEAVGGVAEVIVGNRAERDAAAAAQIAGAVSLEDLLVRTVVAATHEMRADDHLAVMLASEPGDTLGQLTVDGLPRIIRVATVFLAPLVDSYLPRREAARLVELLARLVISYFLAPSDHVDLGDPESAATFIRTFITPAFEASLIRS